MPQYVEPKCHFLSKMINLFDFTSKHIPLGGSLMCFYDLTVRDDTITELDKLFFRVLLLILFFYAIMWDGNQ